MVGDLSEKMIAPRAQGGELDCDEISRSLSAVPVDGGVRFLQ
jgi:hypothetical protein